MDYQNRGNEHLETSWCTVKDQNVSSDGKWIGTQNGTTTKISMNFACMSAPPSKKRALLTLSPLPISNVPLQDDSAFKDQVMACSNYTKYAKEEFLEMLSKEKPKLDESHSKILLQERYNIHYFIGGGSDGNVFYATDREKNNKGVALKVITKDNIPEVKYELQQLETIKGLYSKEDFNASCIIQVNHQFTLNTHIFLSFDLLGPDIYKASDLLGRGFNVLEAKEIIHQVLIAVNFLHNNGVVHTDIKPRNILFCRNSVVENQTRSGSYKKMSPLDIKIIDLDQSVFISSDRKTYNHIVTTLEYRAPEILMGLDWDETCDLWSIGCTLYEIYKNNLLFDWDKHNVEMHLLLIEASVNYNLPPAMCKESTLDIFTEENGTWCLNKTIENDYPDCAKFCKRLHRERLTKSLKDEDVYYFYEILLNGLLRIDPKERIPPSEILAHPWFDFLNEKRGINFD